MRLVHQSVCNKQIFSYAVGCDTGFGLRLAHHLNSLGFTVFAGCLAADREKDELGRI
jgi:hypothetical protein